MNDEVKACPDCIGCVQNKDGGCAYYRRCAKFRKWFTEEWREIQTLFAPIIRKDFRK